MSWEDSPDELGSPLHHCRGPNEKDFAERGLKPHLAGYSIDVRARVVLTNRKLGKRGGIFDYSKIKGDLHRLMRQDRHGEARFTTMIDLYALPFEFPGRVEAQTKRDPAERVSILEKALKTEFSDSRFLPFIQLHEFEALLYCDLEELELRIANSTGGIEALRKEVSGMEPEEINEGPTTAPSKRHTFSLSFGNERGGQPTKMRG